MRSRYWMAWGATVPLLLFPGCTKVPQEVVELSMATEQRITASQVSHEAFVAEYFNLSRVRIEEFMHHQWLPEFLSDFVKRADLMGELENPEWLSEREMERLTEELHAIGVEGGSRDRVIQAVQRGLGDAERGQIILEFAEAAMDEFEAQKAEMLTPLGQRERKAIADVRANYAELTSMQKTITQYLQSVREVKEFEEDILKKLRLQEDRDRLLEEAVRFNNELARILDASEKAEAKVNELRNLLSGGS